MNTLKAKINNYLSKNCIFIFAIVTFLIMLNRVPFWDETHAFSIARLKLEEIFYITRIECKDCGKVTQLPERMSIIVTSDMDINAD